jgi:hypothetical protein
MIWEGPVIKVTVLTLDDWSSSPGRGRNFLLNHRVQTASETHVPGPFPWEYSGRSVNLTIRLYPVLSLGM